jgi:hypothetical protein
MRSSEQPKRALVAVKREVDKINARLTGIGASPIA